MIQGDVRQSAETYSENGNEPRNLHVVRKPSKTSILATDLGMRSRGFLETERLMAALGFQELETPSSRDETIRRVISKLRRVKVVLARYRPGQVVDRVQAAGFANFRMHDHTRLWKKWNAKDQRKKYGSVSAQGNWLWFESWVNTVLNHCEAEGERYR